MEYIWYHIGPTINALLEIYSISKNNFKNTKTSSQYKLEMWANAQPDGRPAEYRWRPLFNAAKFG